MKPIQWALHPIKTVALSIALFGTVTCAVASESECKVEFFDSAQYAGKNLIIEGATQLPKLDNVNGDNWDKRIDSLKVGPKAKLTVFQNPRFELTLTEMIKHPDLMRAMGVTEQDIKEDSELIFIPNSKIHDLGDFNFNKKIRSLKIECIN
jgi:hypothetical protein